MTQANTPCNRNGVRRQPLGVDSAVMGSSVLSFPSLFKFYSLSSFTYEQGITYVVAGSVGAIEQVSINNYVVFLIVLISFYFLQFHLNASLKLEHIRSVNVTTMAEVIEIHVSDDQQSYYLLSNRHVSVYGSYCGLLYGYLALTLLLLTASVLLLSFVPNGLSLPTP